MLIGVGSVKGSPGATTLAVALAASWPDQAPGGGPVGRPVVVEADCAGGDIGGRCWLPDSPGLASLATQARSGAVALPDHVSRLGCGVEVVVAPAGRQAATVAAGLLARADPRDWTAGRPVVLDVGRLDPGAANATLVEALDCLVIVTSGQESALLRLAEAGLPPVPVVVVVNGPCHYTAGEIAAAVGVPVFAVLPWDPRSVETLWGDQPPGPAWARRGPPAAVRALAEQLAPAAGGTRPSERSSAGRGRHPIPMATTRRDADRTPRTERGTGGVNGVSPRAGGPARGDLPGAGDRQVSGHGPAGGRAPAGPGFRVQAGVWVPAGSVRHVAEGGRS